MYDPVSVYVRCFEVIYELLLKYLWILLEEKPPHLDTLNSLPNSQRSRDSDWLRAGRLMHLNSSNSTVKNFLFSTSSRPVLGPTHPPTHWISVGLSPRKNGVRIKLTTHLQLVSRSRKYGSTRPLPHTPSWRSA
jgi:hypothetical protein